MEEKILLIDDDQCFSEIAGEVLRANGYRVSIADSPARAFPMLVQESFNLILCDMHMPFIAGEFSDEFILSYETGVRTIQELRYALPEVPIVGISAAAQSDLDKISGQVFPDVVLSKPTQCEDLVKIAAVFLSDKLDQQNLGQMHVV